jgi:hypothetical protein
MKVPEGPTQKITGIIIVSSLMGFLRRVRSKSAEAIPVTQAKRVTINFVSKKHTNSIFLISTECAAIATPNETSDRVTRLQQARDFLKEYPEEKVTTASRIFKVTRSTLKQLDSQEASR